MRKIKISILFLSLFLSCTAAAIAQKQELEESREFLGYTSSKFKGLKVYDYTHYHFLEPRIHGDYMEKVKLKESQRLHRMTIRAYIPKGLDSAEVEIKSKEIEYDDLGRPVLKKVRLYDEKGIDHGLVYINIAYSSPNEIKEIHALETSNGQFRKLGELKLVKTISKDKKKVVIDEYYKTIDKLVPEYYSRFIKGDRTENLGRPLTNPLNGLESLEEFKLTLKLRGKTPTRRIIRVEKDTDQGRTKIYELHYYREKKKQLKLERAVVGIRSWLQERLVDYRWVEDRFKEAATYTFRGEGSLLFDTTVKVNRSRIQFSGRSKSDKYRNWIHHTLEFGPPCHVVERNIEYTSE